MGVPRRVAGAFGVWLLSAMYTVAYNESIAWI